MGAYGPPAPINDWIFQKTGATIDTPANLTGNAAPREVDQGGYFPADTNALDYGANMGKFIGGTGLFLFNGDWESANLDKQMAGNAGFFLMPPAVEGAKHAAMSAPLTYGIGAKAKNADCAAFFLNWVATNPDGAQDQCRSRRLQPRRPGRPADPGRRARLGAPSRRLPPVASLATDNGAMDFIANATGAIFAEGWTPQLQNLVGGRAGRGKVCSRRCRPSMRRTGSR